MTSGMWHTGPHSTGISNTERVHMLCASKAKSPENGCLETDAKRLACPRPIQTVNNTAHHSLRFSTGDMATVEMEKNLIFNDYTFYKK